MISCTAHKDLIPANPSSPAQLGHMPQEDFADAVHDSMLPWLEGATDEWKSGQRARMRNSGAEDIPR